MEIKDTLSKVPMKKKSFHIKDLGRLDKEVCITKGPTQKIATINSITVKGQYIYINID